MIKQGNQHSSLLDDIVKIAQTKPEKTEIPQKQELEQVLADISKNKNIRKTAQWDSLVGPLSDRPRGEGLQDGKGPHGFGGDMRDEFEAESEQSEDIESAKQSLKDALIALFGSPEAASDFILGEENGREMSEGGLLESDEMSAMPAPMESAY